MATRAERRALYFSEDDSYDPFVGVDVNEYLIDEWPKLNERQRRAIWTKLQNETFDDSDVLEQIDDAVLVLAATEPNLKDDPDFQYDDEEEDDEDDEDDVDMEGYLWIDPDEYITDEYGSQIDEEDKQELCEHILDNADYFYELIEQAIDQLIADYYEDEEEEEDTQANPSTSTDETDQESPQESNDEVDADVDESLA